MNLAAAIFFAAAVLLFFLAAVGSTVIPTATAWGFVAVSIGLLLGAIPGARRASG